MVTYDSSGVLYSASRTTYDGDVTTRDGGDVWTVSIAFDLAANGVGDWLTLDDPVKGILDNVTYLLSGDVLVDVTGYVRSISTNRGRSRTLEKFTAGVASVVLDNRDRAYDPSNVDSPYYGQIVPRKQMEIRYLGSPVFSGMVEDWNFDYTLGGDSTAEVACIDGFARVASGSLGAGTATSQGSGARVTAVLDALSWPAAQRAISTGASTLAADVRAEGTNALAYLQQVEMSEQGAMFMASDGLFTFRSATDLAAGTPITTFGTAGIPFTNLAVVYGTEELVNSVSVVWSAGTAVGGTALVEDTTSQSAYGIIDQTYDTLLSSGTAASAMASAVVAAYKQPKLRVDQVTVSMGGATTSQRNQVIALELSEQATVVWTPNAIGTAISQTVIIDAIEHHADPSRHDVVFTLSEA